MRKEGWPQALNKVVEKAKKTDFSYGKWDCGVFASEALEAISDDYECPYTLHMCVVILKRAVLLMLGGVIWPSTKEIWVCASAP